jgi:hypothetical protein
LDCFIDQFSCSVLLFVTCTFLICFPTSISFCLPVSLRVRKHSLLTSGFGVLQTTSSTFPPPWTASFPAPCPSRNRQAAPQRVTCHRRGAASASRASWSRRTGHGRWHCPICTSLHSRWAVHPPSNSLFVFFVFFLSLPVSLLFCPIHMLSRICSS